MLHQVASCLSGKVVALHLGNCTAKSYRCNQDGTVSPVLSRLVCQILSLTDKHGILLFQHAFLPTSVWRLIICPWMRCFQSGIFSLSWLRQPFTSGALQRWICLHLLNLLNASTIHVGISTTSWGLGVECVQPSLDVSCKLCFLLLY